LERGALPLSVADLSEKREEEPTMKKVFCLALAAVALVTSLGLGLIADYSLASAQASDADATQAIGRGELTAQGDGIAILGGRGIVDVSGNGILWVKDLAGNAVIEVTGYGEKREFEDGWVQYSGFRGSAHIKGGRIIVVIAGVDVELHAIGRGRAILWGHGSYELNGQTGEWNQNFGARMRLAGSNVSTGE
jgi:hypothetical protein